MLWAAPMRLDIHWNDETTSVDLADGTLTVGGGPRDGIHLAGLPHALLTLVVAAGELEVTGQRALRIGHGLFPARVPRRLLRGERLRLPNDAELCRAGSEAREAERARAATACVARELLTGDGVVDATRAATLTCVAGVDRGRVYPLPFARLAIGRAEDADVRLGDRAVSRQHARLERRGDALVLRALSTMNGLYVNGRLVRREQALVAGDLIELGHTQLRFAAPACAESAPATPPPEGHASPALEPVAAPHVAEPEQPLSVAPALAPRRAALDTWLTTVGVALALACVTFAVALLG